MFKLRNVIFACITLFTSAEAHAAPFNELDAVIEKTAQLVRDQFVDEKVARATADILLARFERGAYGDIETAEQLQQTLTAELRAISGDQHIGVVYDPERVARYRARAAAQMDETAKAKDDANKAASAEESRLDNYGLRAVEVMTGGVGYLQIDYFDGHVDESAPVIAAAMNLLASSDAIILDLRRNGGGNSRILPLFLGYFLGPEPVHFAIQTERWKGETLNLVTRADVAGARHTDKPVYILTSGMTFSLAEQVAYHLKSFERATLIGERTHGGGNGWDPVVLNDDFYLRIPRLAFANTVTKTMFTEGEGIAPDISVEAQEAKTRAYVEALATLQSAAAADEETRRDIAWAQNIATARAQHAATSDRREKAYAGNFGPYAFDARAGGLWLSFNGAPFMKLERLAPGLYFDDRSIQRQFQFPQTGRAPVKSVTVTEYGDDPVVMERDKR